MAAKIIFDGKEYPIPTSFTPRELGIIRRASDVRPAELGNAMKEGDAEVLAAIAYIAARRAGDDTLTIDDFLDADVEKFDAQDDEADEAEAEESPPA